MMEGTGMQEDITGISCGLDFRGPRLTAESGW